MLQEPQKKPQGPDPLSQDIKKAKAEQEMRHKEAGFFAKMQETLMKMQNDAQASALQMTREQELHQAELAKKNQSTEIDRILSMTKFKNDAAAAQSQQDSSMSKDYLNQAKAFKEGIITPVQDPQVAVKEAQDIAKSQQDRVSEAVTNIGKQTMAQLQGSLDLMRAKEQEYADDPARKISDAVGAQLAASFSSNEQVYQNALKAVDSQATKNDLAFSPAGKVGQKIGGLLNLLTLPFGAEVGTSLFGGKPNEQQVAEAKLALANEHIKTQGSIFYNLSPAANAELRDSYSNYAMDVRTKGRIAGLPSGIIDRSVQTGSKTNMDGLVGLMNEVDKNLGAKSPLFGAESPIYQAWIAYQNIPQSGSIEEAKAREAQFTESVSTYLSNGGTMQSLLEQFNNSTESSPYRVVDKMIEQYPSKAPPGASAAEIENNKINSDALVAKKVQLQGFFDDLQRVGQKIQKDNVSTSLTKLSADTSSSGNIAKELYQAELVGNLDNTVKDIVQSQSTSSLVNDVLPKLADDTIKAALSKEIERTRGTSSLDDLRKARERAQLKGM